DSLRHFHSERYELFAACVMSDPVHLLFQPWPKNNDDNGSIFFLPVSDLMHSINRFRHIKLTSWRVKQDLFGRRNSSIDMCGQIATCKRSFITCCAIHGIPELAKQNEGYPWISTQHDEAGNESSFRRDAETSTRDACATQ